MPVPWQVENEWQDDGHGNQEDHNPLEQLQTPSGRLVGDFVVDAFQDVQLTQNARIPLLQMEALRGQAVYAGQVLIAQEFEGVIHAFKQDRTIYLHLRNAAQVGLRRAWKAEAAPVVSRQGLVRLIQIVVELLVQVSHLQQLHVGKLQDS